MTAAAAPQQLPAGLLITPLTAINRLMEWRMEVIREVFGQEPTPQLAEANRDYYMRHVSRSEHLALEARVEGIGAGCGAICLGHELPSPDNPDGLCAYLMNIYVRPQWRSRGIASAIVERLIGEARRRGCDKIYLESTDGARRLYTRLGFEPLEGMMKLPLRLSTPKRVFQNNC